MEECERWRTQSWRRTWLRERCTRRMVAKHGARPPYRGTMEGNLPGILRRQPKLQLLKPLHSLSEQYAYALGVTTSDAQYSCDVPLPRCQRTTRELSFELDRGFLYALGEIPRREGLRRGFFSGLWPTVVKGAVNNCIRFGLYNEAAGVLRR